MRSRRKVGWDAAVFAWMRARGARSVRSGGGGGSHQEGWPQSILSIGWDERSSFATAHDQAVPSCRPHLRGEAKTWGSRLGIATKKRF